MDQPERPLNLDRLKRLSDFWNWLPAYRAVAETEHVRTAASRMNVSPSALSRSIGLLEESIGEQLFDREGRGIRLNRAGKEFLGNLRVAMRLIDDALLAVESSRFSGTVHIAAPDDLVGLLWPGLKQLRGDNPELVVRFQSVPRSEVNQRLLKGSLDLAFEQDPKPQPELEIDKFMEASNAVYCGAGHPLWEARDATDEQVLAHAFVAGVDPDDNPVDGWPPESAREVSAVVQRLQAGVEACMFGGLLAALPVHVAAPYCERGLLRRLDAPALPPSDFYVVRRSAIREGDRNAVIARQLADSVA